jgi:hypothetical protein
LPGAPEAENEVARNLSLPPIWPSVPPSKGRNAPVACSDADHVLPMFRTSGPLPLVVAAVMLLKRSGHPMTLMSTLTPDWAVNLAASRLRIR